MAAALTVKASLREALRERRRTLTAQERTQAANAVRNLFLSQINLPADSCVAFTMAQAEELDALPLALALAQQGHALCLPCVEASGAPLVFRAYQQGDMFRLGPLRIPEPLPSAPLVVPDVVLAPLVGFDRKGNRLGQGGGFYDRTLALLRQQKPVMVVGLAFGVQEEPMIPVMPDDEPLDAIVTERAVVMAVRGQTAIKT